MSSVLNHRQAWRRQHKRISFQDHIDKYQNFFPSEFSPGIPYLKNNFSPYISPSTSCDSEHYSNSNCSISISPSPSLYTSDSTYCRKFDPNKLSIITSSIDSTSSNNITPCRTPISPTQKKSVKFSSFNDVILIASRNEYYEAKINNLIWWSDEELNQFKRETVQEVVEYMRLTGVREPTKAIKLMYSVDFFREEAESTEPIQVPCLMPEKTFDSLSSITSSETSSSTEVKDEGDVELETENECYTCSETESTLSQDSSTEYENDNQDENSINMYKSYHQLSSYDNCYSKSNNVTVSLSEAQMLFSTPSSNQAIMEEKIYSKSTINKFNSDPNASILINKNNNRVDINNQNKFNQDLSVKISNKDTKISPNNMNYNNNKEEIDNNKTILSKTVDIIYNIFTFQFH